MTFPSVSGTVAVALAMATVSFSDPAAGKDGPVTVELEAGGYYDSLVVVEEADATTRRGSEALQVRGEVELDFLSDPDRSLALGYVLLQRSHRDAGAQDRQAHTISLSGDTRMGRARAGARYSFQRVRLGGNAFLELQTVSPSVSVQFSRSFHARTAYTLTQKDFERATGRNSESHGVDVTGFWFFAGARSYVALGGQVQAEDAADPAFDFEGYQADAKLKLPAPGSKRGKLIAAAAYSHRDYRHITPAIDATRHEERFVYSAEVEYPLTRSWTFLADYRYIDRNSNLPTVDYTRSVAFTGLRLAL